MNEIGKTYNHFTIELDKDWFNHQDIFKQEVKVVTPFEPVSDTRWERTKIWLDKFSLVRELKNYNWINRLIGLDYSATVEVVNYKTAAKPV